MEFFGRNFLEGFIGGFFWEDGFWKNSLGGIICFNFNVEGIDLFVNILGLRKGSANASSSHLKTKNASTQNLTIGKTLVGVCMARARQ